MINEDYSFMRYFWKRSSINYNLYLILLKHEILYSKIRY